MFLCALCAKFCMSFRLFCTFLLALPALTGAIQINEIMYDPAASESYAEWVELYNNESAEINLTGWFLCDKGILPGYVNKSDGLTYGETNLTLPAGAYAIIADGGSGSTVLNNFTVNASAWLFHINGSEMCTNGLSNSGETITLNRSDRTVYDSVTYNDIASQNYSLGRQSDGSLKQSSLNGGTPGSQNGVPSSQVEYNVTINSFPTSLAFGAQSFVNINFSAGSYNFSKIRIVAYTFDPKFIAIDSTGSKISQTFQNSDTAKEFSYVNASDNIKTNITFNMEANCNSADPTGGYTGRVRVYNLTNATSNDWEELERIDFTFTVTPNQNCPPPSSSSSSSSTSGGSSSSTISTSISVDITKYLYIRNNFEIEALIFNSFESTKEVEIYSYIYRSEGSTEYANTGGATANKQTVTLKPNSKTTIKLTNTIKQEAQGEYTLKVRVKDGTKNYDGTETITLKSLSETGTKVSVEIVSNETVKNPEPSGLTGFFLGLGGNKTGGSNIGGAIIAGASNFISSLINGIIKLFSSVLANFGIRF